MRNALIKLLGGYTESEIFSAYKRHKSLLTLMDDLADENDRLRRVLADIAECETPKASSTVRRMAEMARASLTGERV